MEEQKETKFCEHCGKEIKKSAVFCEYCGGQIKNIKVEIVRKKITTFKCKTTAVILAVFFSFWAWLYTYTKSKIKFWVSILTLLVWYVFLFVYSFTAIFTGASFDFSFNASWYLHISIVGIIWLWAIIGNAVKPASYYKNYPKG